MKISIHILVLTLFLASCSQLNGDDVKKTNKDNKKVLSDATAFPTIGYVKVHKEIIPFAVEKVFPFFEPQGRHLLYDNWDPTVLREGEKGSLKGQVLFSKYDDLDVMLTVREHNPDKGHIQYLVVWDDFEIQRIDIYCTPGETENETNVKWVEHNAGLYKERIPLIEKFVNEGYLDKAVERYVTNIKKKLGNRK